MECECEGNLPVRPASRSEDAPVSGGVGAVLKRGAEAKRPPENLEANVAKMMQET